MEYVVEKKVVINNATGEVLKDETSSKQTVKHRTQKEDLFYMAYTQNIAFLNKLSRGEMLVMNGLLKHADRDNRITVMKHIKEEIGKTFNMGLSAVNNNILSLATEKKGYVLKRIARGYYEINPYLFGTTNIQNIKRIREYNDWNFETLNLKKTRDIEYFSKEELEEIENKRRGIFIATEVEPSILSLKELIKQNINEDFEVSINLKEHFGNEFKDDKSLLKELEEIAFNKTLTSAINTSTNGIFKAEFRPKSFKAWIS